jgi:hypothetical protein
MSQAQPVSILYTLDSQDLIKEVDGDWAKFAAANDGEAVESSSVIGKPLWPYIADTTLRELYRRLVAEARAGRPITFEYRCDAPCYRRLFEMRIRAGAEGAVTFTSRLLAEESRDPVALLDKNQPRSREFLRMCSWCQRVHAHDCWLPIEAALETLGLMLKPDLPRITHGICDSCREKMKSIVPDLGKLA